MGGYGSGRWSWHSKATTVEECRSISIKWLVDHKVVGNGKTSGRITWNSGSSIGYAVKLVQDRECFLELSYTFKNSNEQKDITLPVFLQTTHPKFGGVRWWMTCPLVINNKPCKKRVGKLYLPPGSCYFGCRTCHGLSYESCQESHKFDGMFTMLAVQTGIPISEVKRALKSLNMA